MLKETKETVRTWTSVISAACAVLGVAMLFVVNYHALVHILFGR